MGGLLAQVCLNAGANVMDAKLEVVRKAGASAVNYAQPDWTERVRSLTGGTAVDLVFDGVGGEIGKAATSLVESGGRCFAHGVASGSFTDTAELAAQGVTVIGRPETMVELGPVMRELTAVALKEAAAGRLRSVVGQTFPLERAADAHAAIEARGTVDRTLLLV
ncbi:zinc-binding dehydrogenase [Streptomyces sp. NPDC004237]|uniref:zinc-binding dehydrogenase n=1 Tax=Streptomyces sp. NPDC004237 TaxID=3154455 RepID=UPI0033BBFE1D